MSCEQALKLIVREVGALSDLPALGEEGCESAWQRASALEARLPEGRCVSGLPGRIRPPCRGSAKGRLRATSSATERRQKRAPASGTESCERSGRADCVPPEMPLAPTRGLRFWRTSGRRPPAGHTGIAIHGGEPGGQDRSPHSTEKIVRESAGIVQHFAAVERG